MPLLTAEQRAALDADEDLPGIEVDVPVEMCGRGLHPATPETRYVYYDVKGHKHERCRPCNSERSKEYREQKRTPERPPRCRQGHAIVGDNLLRHVDRQGRERNICRRCQRRRDGEYRERARAKEASVSTAA